VLLGYWIDQASGASPVFTLLLGLGAFAASIARLVQLSSRDSRESRQRREGEDGQRPENR
jgi:F0F1-type ATP synthase assembly protein I